MLEEQKEMTKRMFRLVALFVASALTLAACGSSGVADVAGDVVDEATDVVDGEDSTDEDSGDADADADDDGDADADDSEDEEIQVTQGDSVLESVTEAGVIRVGVRNDNPPISFIDESGEWVGFDLDLARALGDELGLEVELVPVDGTTRITFLESGQIDIAVASLNHTRSRDEAVDFSITYFWDQQSFLVRTGEFEDINELFGETVAASAGSSTIDSWTNFSADAGGAAPEFVEFEDKNAAVEAVRSGAVSGYTEDNITLLSLAAGDPDLTLLPGGHNAVQFGIGVPENQSDWLDTVNFALQDVWTSGEYQELYDRWFVGPDRIIDLPLGGELEIWG